MISALIFDKDGTLFDFTASWGAWVQGILPLLSPDLAVQAGLASEIGFDLGAGRFAKSSPVIAGTPDQIARQIAGHLPLIRFDDLVALLNEQAARAVMQPAVDLPSVLGDLRAMGLRLGLATNDAEAAARAHLAQAGIAHLFDFVAGYDSGFGGKPAPGQLLAFAKRINIPPAQIAMVGDSLHDLHAARAAGMVAIGVLTGVAMAGELGPVADVVLPDIGHIAGWIANA